MTFLSALLLRRGYGGDVVTVETEWTERGASKGLAPTAHHEACLSSCRASSPTSISKQSQ